MSAGGGDVQRSIDGVRLNVLDEGEGPTVLFLHGLGGTWRDWEPQLDDLSSDHRCIVVEHRGHGRSEVTRGELSIELFARDAAGVCAALGVDQAHVVGLSMGGMIAQRLAIDHPSLVRTLVLAATGAFMPEPAAGFLAEWARSVRDQGMPDSRGVVPDRSPAWSPVTLRERPHVARNNMREAESVDPDAWARAALAITRHDTRPDLGRIDVPVLLVYGADDRLVPVDNAEPLRQGIPHAELHVLPDAGHTCNLEQPEAFDALLRDFWRRSTPTAVG